MIQSDTKGNEAVTKGRKRFCLPKIEAGQVVHKGSVRPEAGADMQSHQR